MERPVTLVSGRLICHMCGSRRGKQLTQTLKEGNDYILRDMFSVEVVNKLNPRSKNTKVALQRSVLVLD